MEKNRIHSVGRGAVPQRHSRQYLYGYHFQRRSAHHAVPDSQQQLEVLQRMVRRLFLQ